MRWSVGDGPGDGGLPARQLWRTGLVEKAHERFYRACFPFIIIMLIALLVITYVPWLSLALIEHFGIQ